MGLHRDDSKEPGGAGKEAGGSSDLSRELTAATPVPGTGSRGTPASSIASGTTIGHFEVLELLGAGGFGEVYRARDTRLERMVAIKVLPEDFLEGEEPRARFLREAKALAALSHPNIAAIHSFEEIPGSSPSFTRHLIVMELVEGKTLHAVLANGPLSVERAIPIALQITDALGEAHRAGILHRDIKSGNIALTERGQVKVLDFGIAKLFGSAPETAEGTTVEKLTAEGTSLGTMTHMSPEQLLGKPVDRRSDLFSFGVVLYEMLTGRLPFEGSTSIAVADAILHAEPRDFGERPPPAKLKSIIRKLLEKDPDARYATAEEVHADLKALEASLAPGGLSRNARIAVAIAIVVACSVAGWLWHRASQERWALGQIPEITRLIEAEDFLKAAALLREARVVLPKDPALEMLWLKATGEATIETDPPGAEVSIRPYKSDENVWQSLGVTPLTKIRLPQAWYVWRVTKTGSATITLIGGDTTELSFTLVPEASVPPGMVPVPGGMARLGWPLNEATPIKLGDYLIDRTEVTNEEYKRFLDTGGYRKREFWKEPFVKNGRVLSWGEALALFRDSTGRPGPATWEVGTFPKGKEKHPVAGVSWYEAAAYAEFVGKSLPSAYHWTLAAQPMGNFLIVPGSNFHGKGTQAVGSPGTLSGFGTADMAGNVKEWCLNESSSGTRLILGGGFSDPSYQFSHIDAQSPLERGLDYGFRCVKLASPPSDAASAKLSRLYRDFLKEKQVSDEVFAVFKHLFAYDRGPLNAMVEEREAAGEWMRERISFDAAYSGERVVAHLFLPKNAASPFQVVVFFPGAYAYYQKRFDPSVIESHVDFIPEGGRALVFPIYRGTFERPDGVQVGGQPPAKWRDRVVTQSKDLGRVMDYLETRKDIDATKVAYMGFSAGGAMAPVLLAVEPRFKAAVLWSGGLWFRTTLAEVDGINFVTRVRVPVLMLSDRYDNDFPVETSQVPLYRLLGTPEKDKKRIVYDTGHGRLPHKELIRETFDWLDKYLGPVMR